MLKAIGVVLIIGGLVIAVIAIMAAVSSPTGEVTRNYIIQAIVFTIIPIAAGITLLVIR